MVSMLDGSTLCYQAGDTCRPFTTQVAIPSNSLLPPSPGRGQSWLLIQSLASSAKGFQVGRDVKVLSLRRPDWPRLSHGWSGLVQDCMRHMITTLEAERRPGMPDVAPCANVPPPPPGKATQISFGWDPRWLLPVSATLLSPVSSKNPVDKEWRVQS